jgi:hypothetical protein
MLLSPFKESAECTRRVSNMTFFMCRKEKQLEAAQLFIALIIR